MLTISSTIIQLVLGRIDERGLVMRYMTTPGWAGVSDSISPLIFCKGEDK